VRRDAVREAVKGTDPDICSVSAVLDVHDYVVQYMLLNLYSSALNQGR
jgi:hypothetical protein